MAGPGSSWSTDRRRRRCNTHCWSTKPRRCFEDRERDMPMNPCLRPRGAPITGTGRRGHLRRGDPLHAPETGTTVRISGGERDIQDGPYANTKEQLAGFTFWNWSRWTPPSIGPRGVRARHRRDRGQAARAEAPSKTGARVGPTIRRRSADARQRAEARRAIEQVARQSYGRHRLSCPRARATWRPPKMRSAMRSSRRSPFGRATVCRIRPRRGC